jgi:hypothetical protein
LALLAFLAVKLYDQQTFRERPFMVKPLLPAFKAGADSHGNNFV